MPHKYYNAFNLFYQAYYPKLKEVFDRYQSWPIAWKNLKKEVKVDADKEWERLLKNDVRLLLPEDQHFPPLLKEIPLAPFGIYIKGSFVFSLPAVAVVGTRKATNEGLRLSQKFGRELAEQGLTVVSGLALGIDQAAHRGALEVSQTTCDEPGRTTRGEPGRTIAVLANGLDDIYPSQNRLLAEKIITAGGALVSEYPLGTPSLPYQFLERNRVISGLSLAVLVIEAPFESGALVTVKHAVEQNREVLVVPGSITHPNYVGSHQLIKSGAALVSCVDDVFQNLNLPFKKAGEIKKQTSLTQEQKMVLNYIETAGHSLPVDKIIELTKLEPRIVNQTLTSLVINDIIKEYNGRYSLL